MEKSKNIEAGFVELVSEIKKKESLLDYKERLFGEKTKKEKEEEIQNQKRQMILSESLNIVDESELDFDIKIKYGKFLKIFREWIEEIVLIVSVFSVGIITTYLSEWISADNQNRIGMIGVAMIVTFVLNLIITENGNVRKKLEDWWFNTFEKEKLIEYENKKYDYLLGGYLYKKYQKLNDAKFNSYLLNELIKKEVCFVKMYCMNTYDYCPWNKEIEKSFMLKLINNYKE